MLHIGKEFSNYGSTVIIKAFFFLICRKIEQLERNLLPWLPLAMLVNMWHITAVKLVWICVKKTERCIGMLKRDKGCTGTISSPLYISSKGLIVCLFPCVHDCVSMCSEVNCDNYAEKLLVISK